MDAAGTTQRDLLDEVRAARVVAVDCDGHVPRELMTSLEQALAASRADDRTTRAARAELERERDALIAFDIDRRRTRMLRIRASVARLKALPSRSAMIEAAPVEACRSCGFSRTLLSRIEDGYWIPELLCTTAPSEEPSDFNDYLGSARIPLEHMLVETEIVRRNRPALIRDARADPRAPHTIIRASGAHSYTAAPIVPGRRALGFLHCDRLGQAQPMTEDDRDNLSMFAGQLALLFDTAAVADRLHDFEARAREVMEAALVDIAALRTADLRVTEEPPGILDRADDAVGVPTSRLLLALTERQRQVLELLATGATNHQIADELVVSEATVKTHIKGIFRRLRVNNRSEAVARYLQTTGAR